MQMTEFVEKLKGTYSSSGNSFIYNCKSNKERTIQEIICVGKSRLPKQFTKTDILNQVLVIFKKSCALTVFQVNTLFEIWVRGMTPMDYAAYHKCQAGIEFIDNIYFIRSIDKRVMEDMHKISMLTEKEKNIYYRLQEKMEMGKLKE